MAAATPIGNASTATMAAMTTDPTMAVDTPADSGLSDRPEVMKPRPRSEKVGQALMRMSPSKTTRIPSEIISIRTRKAWKRNGPSLSPPLSRDRWTISRVRCWDRLAVGERVDINRPPGIGERFGCSAN